MKKNTANLTYSAIETQVLMASFNIPPLIINKIWVKIIYILFIFQI